MRSTGWWLAAALAAAALGARPALAASAAHGRVSAVQGDLLIKGTSDADWSYAAKNSVVYDGDHLWSDQNSAAEVELERGAWLRLGPESEVDVQRLPPNGDVRLARGTLTAD